MNKHDTCFVDNFIYLLLAPGDAKIVDLLMHI